MFLFYFQVLKNSILFFISVALSENQSLINRFKSTPIGSWSDTIIPECSFPDCKYSLCSKIKSLLLWVKLVLSSFVAYTSCFASDCLRFLACWVVTISTPLFIRAWANEDG